MDTGPITSDMKPITNLEILPSYKFSGRQMMLSISYIEFLSNGITKRMPVPSLTYYMTFPNVSIVSRLSRYSCLKSGAILSMS